MTLNVTWRVCIPAEDNTYHNEDYDEEDDTPDLDNSIRNGQGRYLHIADPNG